MSGLLPSLRYVERSRELRAQYQQSLGELDRLAAQNRAHVDELHRRREEALAELCTALIPDLEPATLARAVSLTGYLPLASVDAAQQIATESDALGRRLAEIEGDRRYRDRLLLRAPRIGMLTREIAELEEFLSPLIEFTERAQHPRLQGLLANHYGTPQYSVPFWRVSYYQDWSAGDEILARFPTHKSFAEVRQELIQARETRVVYENKIAKLRQEILVGEQLEAEYETKKKERAALPERMLSSLRGQLARYLLDLDLVAIGDRLETDPALYGLAKRFAGLTKQVHYLRESGQHLVESNRTLVRQSIAQLDKEIVKYSRRKYSGARLNDQSLERHLVRQTKLRQQTRLYQDTSTVVYSFRRYEAARIDDDFLWWSLITQNRLSGQYIDEVARFHAHHPEHHRGGSYRDAGGDSAFDAAAAATHRSGEDRSSTSDIS